MIEEKIVLRIVNETQADLKKFANLYKKTITDAQKEQRRLERDIQKTTEVLKKQNQQLKEAQKVTKQALAPLVGASRASTKEVNRLKFAILETQGKLSGLNKEQQKYRDIIKSENKLLKDNTEQQNKLNNTKQGIVAMGDAARETTRRLQSISKVLLTVGLSSLFAGLALRNFGLKILRSLFNTFQQVTEGTAAYAETVGKLQAAFEFLKYTIIDTFLSTELGKAIFEKLVELFNYLSDLIQKYPNISTAIVGGAAGLAALGTLLFLFGQIASALSGLFTLFTETSKTAPEFKKQLSAVGKAAGLADNDIKALGDSFDNMFKKVKTLDAPTSKLSKIMKFLIPAGLIKSGGKFLKLFGKIFLIIGLIDVVITALKGVWEGLTNSINKNEETSNRAGAALELLKSILKGVWDEVSGLISMFDDLISTLGEWVGSGLGLLIQGLGFVAEKLGFIKEGIEDVNKETVKAPTQVLESTNEAVKNSTKNLQKTAESASSAANTITNATATVPAATAVSTGAINTTKESTSIISKIGKFVRSLNPFKKQFARGGIVTSPTTALIGEAGPEAVIPLSRMGETNVGGINVTVNVSQTNASPEMIGNAVLDTLQQSLRRKGLSAGL